MSSPIKRPPPEESEHHKQVLLPRLTAPIAVALSGRWPTITVSTMAMLIQPSSASTRGSARRSVGRISLRKVERLSIKKRSRKCMRCVAKWQSRSGDREVAIETGRARLRKLRRLRTPIQACGRIAKSRGGNWWSVSIRSSLDLPRCETYAEFHTNFVRNGRRPVLLAIRRATCRS